ncbi:MAG: CarD family transcriptional regulator [Clostridiaceae bacterium]|nr:CarD family transcriptional regulator [Clostridiaceae bacterium]
MFKIGDKVVYPMHGAGIIESIEEREVFGEIQKYYVMKMPLGDMKVLVPMANVKEIGIRDIMDKEQAKALIESFKDIESDVESNWNKRYRENLAKIKNGNVYEVACVVKTLMCRDKIKGLSTGERKMLSNAKQILISEIVLATGARQEEIEDLLSGIVEKEVLSKK